VSETAWAHPLETTGPEDRAQVIRASLREAISDRRLAPATKLTEAEVGAHFKASRTVVRAALQILAHEGLVMIERNRGAFVASPSPDEVQQLFASRRLIEAKTVEAAAERFTSADAKIFRSHLKQEQQYISQRGLDGRRAQIKASGEFHLLVARVAANAVLHKFMTELIARSSLAVGLYGRSGASSCGQDEHSQIVDALERHDAKTASRLMLHHINHIEIDLDLRVIEQIALKDALRL
jgi:DNA-binding GntR family transcriptional regulator